LTQHIATRDFTRKSTRFREVDLHRLERKKEKKRKKASKGDVQNRWGKEGGGGWR